MIPFDFYIFICLYIQTKFNNYLNVFFFKLHSYLKYFLILLKKYIYILDVKLLCLLYIFSQSKKSYYFTRNFI